MRVVAPRNDVEGGAEGGVDALALFCVPRALRRSLVGRLGRGANAYVHATARVVVDVGVGVNVLYHGGRGVMGRGGWGVIVGGGRGWRGVVRL